ncbi:MAG: helix-turn-helix domain-containing protein [Firmicutes bacterium]|nr:helix-turn-helix domain-containing protein [Bacillota bacterium]
MVRTSKILGTNEATVRRRIECFEQDGIDSLCDRPRSGIERDVLSSPASHGHLFTI